MPDSDTKKHTNLSIEEDETARPAARSTLITWFRRKTYDHLIAPLVGSRNPPWYDARGVAIGVMVGFGTPVGAHTAAVCLLRLAVRFNFVAALAFTWVCNPFNVIILYYGYYYLGSFLLGRSPDMSFHMFEKLILPIAEKGHFWEALSEFTQLSQDLLARWFAAALLLALVSGVFSYFLTRYFQTRRCKKTAQKMGVEYEKLVTELEEKVAASDQS
jgi:uncharacterized protein (DUF2062 family)